MKLLIESIELAIDVDNYVIVLNSLDLQMIFYTFIRRLRVSRIKSIGMCIQSCYCFRYSTVNYLAVILTNKWRIITKKKIALLGNVMFGLYFCECFNSRRCKWWLTQCYTTGIKKCAHDKMSKWQTMKSSKSAICNFCFVLIFFCVNTKSFSRLFVKLRTVSRNQNHNYPK